MGREIAILGIGRSFFKRSKTIFSFVIFFLATVAAVRTFRTITTIVCSTMSKVKG